MMTSVLCARRRNFTHYMKKNMENQITKIEEKKPNFDVELVKRTIAKDATDDELKLFLYTAQRTGLDPLTRQIHFVKRKNKKYDPATRTWGEETTMTIQTGIDGYRAIAERSGSLAGIDDAIYDSEDGEHPKKASVTVHRIINGIRCPFTATARWTEYAQIYEKDEYINDKKTGKKISTLGPMWKKMPYLMLAKCAEALALRKAFPNDLTGIYTNEEMQQADAPQVVETVPQNVVKATTTPVAKSSNVVGCPGFDSSGKCGAPLTGTYTLCYNCNLKKKYGKTNPQGTTKPSPAPTEGTGELTPEEIAAIESNYALPTYDQHLEEIKRG